MKPSIIGASVRAHATCLDWHRPFLDLALDEGTEPFRALLIPARDRRAEALHALLHGRSLDRLDGCGVELLDHRVGRAFGQEQRAPGIGLHIDALLAGGWQL